MGNVLRTREKAGSDMTEEAGKNAGRPSFPSRTGMSFYRLPKAVSSRDQGGFL